MEGQTIPLDNSSDNWSDISFYSAGETRYIRRFGMSELGSTYMRCLAYMPERSGKRLGSSAGKTELYAANNYSHSYLDFKSEIAYKVISEPLGSIALLSLSTFNKWATYANGLPTYLHTVMSNTSLSSCKHYLPQ